MDLCDLHSSIWKRYIVAKLHSIGCISSEGDRGLTVLVSYCWSNQCCHNLRDPNEMNSPVIGLSRGGFLVSWPGAEDLAMRRACR